METRQAKCIKDVLTVPLTCRSQANNFKPCSHCFHTSPCFANKTKKNHATFLPSNCFRKLEIKQQSKLTFDKVVVVNLGQEVKFIV